MSVVGLAKAYKRSNVLSCLWDFPLLDGLDLFEVQSNAITTDNEVEICNLLQAKLALLCIGMERGVEFFVLQSLKDLLYIQQMFSMVSPS